MKIKRLLSLPLLIACSCCFIACEQNVSMETVVNENGSVSRTIVLQEVDSAKMKENIFGVSEENGWKTKIAHVGKNKFDVSFTKEFPSVEAINSELNSDDEALFRVRSELTEKFRWFYTYYRYSDTYTPINRMHGVKQDDFFTHEDFSFIERLPAEGKAISKADSFFLVKLNDRIYEDFLSHGYYEEHFSALLQALDKIGAAPQWKDSLLLRKGQYFDEILQSEDFDDANFPVIVERFHAPVDMEALRATHKQLTQDFEQRVDFMTNAASMKMVHSIQLPWKIMETNADSLALNRAFWRPPVIKFVLKDHTMYAEGRSFNLWAGLISIFIVLITIRLFTRKKPVVAGP